MSVCYTGCMEQNSSPDESDRLTAAMSDAAQEALLESELPATDVNAAIVAEVAASAREGGLIEASKMVDRVTDEQTADRILRVIARAALRTGAVDRLVLRDYVILVTSAHSAEYYRERRRLNAIRRHANLEIVVRRQTRGNTPT